ncbi:hypothetical protein L7F22_040450 [Adiantum nelumboides]|nr:hypothetical protein [Adiantum nelumboides]
MADHMSRVESGKPATGVDDDLPDNTLFKVDVASSWYHDILILLSTVNFPIDLTPLEKRRLLLKSKPFTLIGGQLYKAGLDGILRRCLAPHEVQDILADAHEGHIGGHQSGPTTAEKILQSGLWWPYLFRDAIAFAKQCDTCQRCAPKPSRLANRPLQVSMAWLPFERWGIDFVGPITPTAQPSGARYLLVATDYATKWAEVAPTKDCTAATVAKFLYQNIFCRFGCPLEITSDQGTHFVNDLLATMFHKYQIFHRKSCSYYPRANGQAESTNKVLLMLLRKTCYLHPTTWADAVLGTTWAYRTSFKATTKHTPFQLAFGLEAIAPFEFINGSVRVGSLRVQNVGGDVANTSRLAILEESRLRAALALSSEQLRRKAWHDRHLRKPRFTKGSLVMLYQAKFLKKAKKLLSIWQGPFKVQEVLPQGAVQLVTLEGVPLPLVNGSRITRKPSDSSSLSFLQILFPWAQTISSLSCNPMVLLFLL